MLENIFNTKTKNAKKDFKTPYELIRLIEGMFEGTYLVRFGFEDKISNLLSKNSYCYCDKCNEDI